MPQAWMINPEENPRRRRRKQRRAEAHRRVRRARANENPARRHRRGRRRLVMHHRRGRRNPRPAFRIPGGIDLGKAGIGVLGAIVSDLGGEWAHGMLPKTMDPSVAKNLKYPIKAATVLAMAMVLGRFVGRAAGATAGLGGAILLGVDAAREFVLPNLPVLHGGLSGLGYDWDDMTQASGYVNPGVGAYVRSPELAGDSGITRGWNREWGSAT